MPRAFHAFILLGLLLSGPVRAENTASAPPPHDDAEERLHSCAAELKRVVATPRCLPVLHRLIALEPMLTEPQRLVDLLDAAVASPPTRPECRSLAHYGLARVARQLGDEARVRAELDALGFARAGLFIGGFDNENGRGHDVMQPPEKEPFHPAVPLAGQRREQRWRELPPLDADGRVPLDELLGDTREQSFHAAFRLVLDAPAKVRIAYGTSGPSRLWVNGVAAAVDGDDHPARFDQRAVVVALPKGAHHLQLKVSNREERPGFYLRAVDAERHVAVGRFMAPEPWTPKAARSERASPTVEDPLAALKRLVESDDRNAALHEDLALALAEQRPFDSRWRRHVHEQERATALAPTDARAWFRLARYLPDDEPAHAEALERALALDPSHLATRVELAEDRMSKGGAHDAAALLSSVTSASQAGAVLSLSNAFDALGLEGKAQRLVLDAAEAQPRSPALAVAAARALKTLGRVDAAEAAYRRTLSLRRDHLEALGELAALSVDRGDVDGALALWSEASVRHPANVTLRRRAAQVAAANGHRDTAEAEFRALARLAPEDVAVAELFGRMLMDGGRDAEALAEFERALSLRPQNPALRELVRAMGPSDRFADPYLPEIPDLIREEGRAMAADAALVVLSETDVVRVFENGLSSRVHREVIRIEAESGIDALRALAITYAPNEKQARVEAARIHRKDGGVVDLRGEEIDRDASGGYEGMFFDLRQRVVAFQNLGVGDFVEWSWRLDDIAQSNMFGEAFGDLHLMQSGHPKRRCEYVLIAPKTRAIEALAPQLPGVRSSTRMLEGGLVERRWWLTDVPQVVAEPGMPGPTETLAHLHLSTFRDWNAVAAFWWGLVREQLHVTPSVARAAEEAVKGIARDDLEAIVRAVYGAVVTQTRYVGLEFGVHGYKPYPVDKVLERRFGDCKDKASLMHAMLAHLGITSRLVLVRTRPLGRIAPAPASLAPFNHAILYVPGLDRYFDGTAEFSGSTELPEPDQGAQALVVVPPEDGESRFVTLPKSRADENLTTQVGRIVVAASGDALLEGRTEVVGSSAQAWRRHYESPDDRVQRFEQFQSSRHPGSQVLGLELSPSRALERPVAANYRLRLPAFAASIDNGSLVFQPMGDGRMQQRWAALGRRMSPLVLGVPWESRFDLEVVPPGGQRIASEPMRSERASRFGRYRFEATPTERGMRFTGLVALDAETVSPEDYPAFRAFLGEIDRLFATRWRIVTGGAAEALR